MKKIFWIFFTTVMLVSCARVGSPNGGTKDSLAPKFLSANIDSARINIPTDLKELRIDFDEYITLKDIQKNLIISPPIQYKKILPSQLGNKYILIQWEDSLKANTTYNFNFGNAIRDLNEGNILPYYNFAFSTGSKLDSLYVSGEVTDGTKRNTETSAKSDSKKNYVVGLYQDNDSINYSKKPYYITKADPDGYFEINYLTLGKYRVVAFDDANENSIFEQGKEDAAFLKEAVNVDKSISGLKLKIFPNKKTTKFVEAKKMNGGILMLFEGNPNEVTVKFESEKLTNYKFVHKPKSDSATVWFDGVKLNVGTPQNENLKFSYTMDGKEGKSSFSYKADEKTELTLSNIKGGTLPPNSIFEISSNMPIQNIQTESWALRSDSISQTFEAKISEKNPYKILVSSNFLIGKKYELSVPKETVSSYDYQITKGYQFNFDIDKAENYGTLTLKLENKPLEKFWVELLDEQDKILYAKYTDQSEVEFTELKPGKCYIRIRVDNNGNGVWDLADFATQTMAEDVYVRSKIIEIRPLWKNVETWNLQQAEDEKGK